jgi:multicomponent Na+:H+ antiporter subunit C
MFEYILSKYNYWMYIVIILIGFYAMMAKGNFMKKLIGMGIFQWAIIFYFMSIGAKKGAGIHIVGGHGAGAAHTAVQAAEIINPLPSVLMLTAIVVGVATTGITLSVIIMIFKRYGTLDEDEITIPE